MISPHALPDRRDADLPAFGFGRILAAFAPGLAVFALLVIGVAAAGLVSSVGGGRTPSQVPSLRPVFAVVSAAAPKATQDKATAVLKIERETTAVAADVELVSDPAMPGPASVAATPRRFGLAGFREAPVSPPPAAPAGSPLRPPRAA
ncbi:hypothetical protein [Methylobacterium aerolatum]|uniref:Uncharacterized protein n=1 Tax=Methylobacterium aerolatum TaxID=418708 RepID=A0ABU0I742_9HYPH|nr:hypothetical protein [Methylobacterium aerolatum]MDQ0449710.1 hypothetical protein [Methylobacterium aerolatum]GJD37183.1 hypothetical protein FMGBMHLM_4109 [Methylobacterium aerolatum]